VALGAGVLASRLAGHGVERVLVDVSPFSFGPSYLGERGDFPYPHCYHPIIYRNTPLPVTRTESYATAHPHQTSVQIEIYQGEDDDALKNLLVGDFRVEGLRPTREPNEVLCRMSLDVDGILHVTAIEKETGKSKHITIARALREKSPSEIAAARERLRALYSSRVEDNPEIDENEFILKDADGVSEEAVSEPEDKAPADLPHALEIVKEAHDLLEQSQRLLGTMHLEDREEAIELHERIQGAVRSNDAGALKKASAELRELLFFVEGR
jgi:molecular chaperone DnaK (HSP70)